MFKWLFHILIFATSGKYQNKEKPLKRQRKLGLMTDVISEGSGEHVCLQNLIMGETLTNTNKV